MRIHIHFNRKQTAQCLVNLSRRIELMASIRTNYYARQRYSASAAKCAQQIISQRHCATDFVILNPGARDRIKLLAKISSARKRAL